MSAPESAAVTPGQAAYEAHHALMHEQVGLESGHRTYERMPSAVRARWEAGAQAAITARQPQPAPGDASGLLEPLHALAAKWDAAAARNQRNGQSLIDQGDEYGNEGLAVAEALGACVVDLRAVLADAPEPQPAPGSASQVRRHAEQAAPGELATLLADWRKTVAAERDEAREQLATTKLVLQETSRESSQHGAELGAVRATLTQVLSWFGDNTSGRYARVSGTVLARAYRDGGLTVPEELRRYL